VEDKTVGLANHPAVLEQRTDHGMPTILDPKYPPIVVASDRGAPFHQLVRGIHAFSAAAETYLKISAAPTQTVDSFEICTKLQVTRPKTMRLFIRANT
jgi:hypothetical protein